MHYAASVATEIIEMLQSVLACPICIIDPDMEILASTGEKEIWDSFVMLSKETESIQKAAERLRISLRGCQFEEKEICYLAAEAENGESVLDWASTVFMEKYIFHIKSQQELINRKRSLLTNQLAGASKSDLEMESYFRILRCGRDLFRCAVLCMPCSIKEGEDAGAYSKELEGLIDIAQSSKILSEEDIYGITNNQLLIFKRVSSVRYSEYRESVKKTVFSLSDCMSEQTDGRIGICACIGSAYRQDRELTGSYREAVYLSSGIEHTRRKKGECLFINEYIFEFLFSGLDRNVQKMMIGDIKEMIDNQEIISETVLALVNNENRPTLSSKELRIHKNTMLQRIQKLKNEMGLDPLYNIRDRALLDIYFFQKKQKIVWNAGVMVQPGNALYQGLEFLSFLLKLKSEGTFQLNLHTVSTSGDNSRLFSMLTAGNLDIAVGSTLALGQYAGDWILALQTPFLFAKAKEAEYVIKKTVLPELSSNLEKTGILCFDIWSMGWRYLTSKGTAIRTPSDMKDRRIRILASTQIQNYFQSLGAVPFQIYYNNISEALAANIIECQENPYSNILAMEFWRYQEFVTELKLFYSMEALCISLNSWSKLEPERKAFLRQAIEESGRWMQKRTPELNALAKAELQKRGMKIVIPDEEDIALWKETIVPLYHDSPYQDFLKKIQRAKTRFSKQKDNRINEED